MDLLMNLTNRDFVILGFSLISAIVFAFIWNDKLFKFYFGVIIGFLLFLVFNSQIIAISFLKDSISLDSWQSFLSKNQSFVLSFFTCMIPVFWLFFTLNNTIHLSLWKSLIQSIIFWVFLLPFLLGIFVYIDKNSFLSLQFLKDILSFIDPSGIKSFFQGNAHLVFMFLLFILFYKMIFWFFLFIFSSIFSSLAAAAKKSQEKSEEHAEEHDEEHHSDSHEDHHHSHH